MVHLTLVGLSEDRTRLLLVDDAGDEFTLGVDPSCAPPLRGEHARLGQLEIEMDSALRPRDIQARIRAGETPEAVAAAAKTTVEKIMPYAAPVLAEREHVAERAQRSSVRRQAGEGRPVRPRHAAHPRRRRRRPPALDQRAARHGLLGRLPSRRRPLGSYRRLRHRQAQGVGRLRLRRPGQLRGLRQRRRPLADRRAGPRACRRADGGAAATRQGSAGCPPSPPTSCPWATTRSSWSATTTSPRRRSGRSSRAGEAPPADEPSSRPGLRRGRAADPRGGPRGAAEPTPEPAADPGPSRRRAAREAPRPQEGRPRLRPELGRDHVRWRQADCRHPARSGLHRTRRVGDPPRPAARVERGVDPGAVERQQVVGGRDPRAAVGRHVGAGHGPDRGVALAQLGRAEEPTVRTEVAVVGTLTAPGMRPATGSTAPRRRGTARARGRRRARRPPRARRPRPAGPAGAGVMSPGSIAGPRSRPLPRAASQADQPPSRTRTSRVAVEPQQPPRPRGGPAGPVVVHDHRPGPAHAGAPHRRDERPRRRAAGAVRRRPAERRGRRRGRRTPLPAGGRPGAPAVPGGSPCR